MSDDDPLLSKMDALLKKHRGQGDAPVAAQASRAAASAPQPGWLPVLTQVLERGAVPEPAAASTEPPAPTPVPVDEAPPQPLPAVSSDALLEQLMHDLAPRLSDLLDRRIAAALHTSLDQTLAHLRSQLDADLRALVRDAVADRIGQPRDPQ